MQQYAEAQSKKGLIESLVPKILAELDNIDKSIENLCNLIHPNTVAIQGEPLFERDF